jgi:predicted transcriptional regulator YdeE/DNA-binding transcriptional MerR regulator
MWQRNNEGNLMIKIGDFSKLALVSIKTLHHYGELGLFKPAHIDRYNGYRYYTLDQLPKLNRILALKDLGFTLEQISKLLDENLHVSEMRGMLRMKQMELAKTVSDEQSRLLNVERRLLQLEKEGQPPENEIALKEVPSQTILTARAVAASEEMLIPTKLSLKELLQRSMSRARLTPNSPWFSLVDNLPYDKAFQEVTLAVAVDAKRNQRSGDWDFDTVRLEDLPAIPCMASLIHEGEYAGINQTYTHLYGWTQTNGYQITGPCREIHLSETGVNTAPFENMLANFTEVQCPVARVSIPISILSPKDQKEKIMEPKITTKPSFKSIGLSYIGKNEKGQIPQMWGVFNQRYPEIKTNDDSCCYGLCFSTVESAQEGEFEYIAAAEVEHDQDIPEGMVYREVPAYKYAVFTHHGKLDKLHETYKYIYETWLPQSNLRLHPDKFDMELYDERFIPDSEESAFDIYVALK